jgi:hypothetical protein
MDREHLYNSLKQYIPMIVIPATVVFVVAVFSSETFNMCIEKVYLSTDPLELCCGTFPEFFNSIWNEVLQNGELHAPADMKNTYFEYPVQILFGALFPFRAYLNVLHQIMEYVTPILIIYNFAPAVLESVGEFFSLLGRDYPRTCLIGWNIFIEENGRFRLKIPTEETFQLYDMFSDDRFRYQSVLNEILNTKDFIVEIRNKKLKGETVRRARNMISKAVKSSRWPKFAHLKKNSNRTEVEKALFLLTYEKDAPVKLTRLWIIFPEELRMLLQYKDYDEDQLRQVFILEEKHWLLRIQNLIQWAVRHFEEGIPSDEVDLPIY